eukprot:TRINITY_DN2507_c0_g1_i1.p1 TRINITY_DN2507_c0_g1~~TRINITY_DN2507_c0_g1_i1.p1  ORF type:complete len:839 (+),score=182.29 TRINITY_DN2507_c0_g1_i1:29-2518(+)
MHPNAMETALDCRQAGEQQSFVNEAPETYGLESAKSLQVSSEQDPWQDGGDPWAQSRCAQGGKLPQSVVKGDGLAGPDAVVPPRPNRPPPGVRAGKRAAFAPATSSSKPGKGTCDELLAAMSWPREQALAWCQQLLLSLISRLKGFYGSFGTAARCLAAPRLWWNRQLPSTVASSSTLIRDMCGCTMEEYIANKIHHRLQGLVFKLRMNDRELLELGQTHFKDQAKRLQQLRGSLPELDRLLRRNDRGPDRGFDGLGMMHARWPDGPQDERVTLEEEDNPFWWRDDVESLCFGLAVTHEEDLTYGAPPALQWWDIEKVAESDNFVAISKPAGMFVVTDERGLWEKSPTNFIHVAHRRVEMPTRDEPRQRGLCHRLDSHTSGIQIFGKSWGAFRHFVVQNGCHRVQKEYIALLDGRLGGTEGPFDGVVDVPMKKWQDYQRREFGSIVCTKTGQGSPAVTKYTVLRHYFVPAKGRLSFWGKDRWFTLVQLRILTGRTHQIRLHMAFLGHPLVGDIKYSAANFEHDNALTPRIFLHCLRMEFHDMDGETFVASSELCPDLQTVLHHIQTCAGIPSSEEVADKESCNNGEEGDASEEVGFPGLAGLLSKSTSLRPTRQPEAKEKEAKAETIVHFCKNCQAHEIATCRVISKGTRRALYWKLESYTGEEPPQISTSRRGQTWGPNVLWVPTELKQADESSAEEEQQACGSPAAEAWETRGLEWAWAHNGTRQNGWIKPLANGALATKWGRGTWQFLEAPDPASRRDRAPLMLASFGATQHVLRLMPLPVEGHRKTFEVVFKQHTQDAKPFDQDMLETLFQPDMKPSCPTRGWLL